MRNQKIIVWFNPHKNSYYYKMVKGTYANYEVGYTNSYNHKIIFIIDNVYVVKPKVSIKTRLIKRLIRFLERIK